MTRSRPRTERLRRGALLAAAACAAAVLSAACADTDSSIPVETPKCVPSDGALPHEKLSEYCFFQGDMKDLVPADRAVEYQVAAALWSDHAAKQRMIVLPEGKKITFDPGENWQFPI